VDNRLMSLQLVEQRLTNAALFAPDGEVLEPNELLYHAPVLIERGSFRPITAVTLDMLEQSLARMRSEPEMKDRQPVVLMEMTLRNLMATTERVQHEDFLARVDTLAALGRTVMVSNYSRFHNVTTYLRRYTREPVGMVLGVPTLTQIFDPKYYADLQGGILEALGRLLGGGPVRLYIYPARNRESGVETSAESFAVAPELTHLYAHLLANGFIRPLPTRAGLDLGVTPHDVLALMEAGDPSWESNVPAVVARVIRERRLFGLRGLEEAS
jgi:hypothetical protein